MAAAKGDRGTPGKRGERGEQGVRGPRAEKLVVVCVGIIIAALVFSNVLSLKINHDNDKQAEGIQAQADANSAINAKQNILLCDVAIILKESPPATGPQPHQSAKSFKRQVKAAVGVIATADSLDCKKIVTDARRARSPKTVNKALKEVGLEPDLPSHGAGGPHPPALDLPTDHPQKPSHPAQPAHPAPPSGGGGSAPPSAKPSDPVQDLLDGAANTVNGVLDSVGSTVDQVLQGLQGKP